MATGLPWALTSVVPTPTAPQTTRSEEEHHRRVEELAAVSVGEGGRASQPQLDEVLTVEMFVVPVAARVQVYVG